VKNAVKPIARAAAGMLPAAALAGLGLPALGAMVFLAVLALAVTCWIISSPDRADRLNRLLLATRGDARCLKPAPHDKPTVPAPTVLSRKMRATTRTFKERQPEAALQTADFARLAPGTI
jgi:hypothetical protein